MTIPPVAAPAPVRPGMSPRVHRAVSVAWTIFIVVCCMLLAISAGGSYGTAVSSFPQVLRTYAFLATFPMLAVSLGLIWRHRVPVLVNAVAVGATIVFPTVALPVLVSVAAVAAARTGRRRILSVGATWLAVSASLWWNLGLERSGYASTIGQSEVGPESRVVLAWLAPVIALVALAPFVAFGIARRYRLERDEAQAGTAAATRNVDVLHREVERERERQELARELHDTMAARLSAVSLHAGTLELMTDGKDAEVARAAKSAREASQGALDGLRDVVRVLRNPQTATPAAGLADLATLVDEATRGGLDVRAQMFVSDPGTCDRETSHAAHRILQEAISNVRRHAPGAALRLEVRGGPESGVTITVMNWVLPDVRPSSIGGGNGLSGMDERVQLVGGTLQAGPTGDGAFMVRAWLPWGRREPSLR